MNDSYLPDSHTEQEDDATTGLEIAVIGMAGRFPGANSVDQFWRNVVDGVESLTEFTDEELLAAGENPELLAHPSYVRVGRIIDSPNDFDAALFGFSPNEAELVDPQQRLLLECAYEALERAGYDTERYDDLVGVFVGIKMTTYLWNIYSNPKIMRSVGDLSAQIANDKDYAATRISYKLNLGGPSVVVQSACSTALVGIHLACQALLSGECEMALAGGVAVRTEQTGGYVYREGDLLSPDGRIRTFDANARGTIFGNGLGIVVLKRLEDALADGDHISAVIKGSAVNNDSANRMGFTTPGADGQERVVRAALTAAEVEPESISYLEAHGTGTAVGDPVEVTALTRAWRASTEKKGFCAIGSVKTNIGHLGAAAGVAGVIKTALALEQRVIPPSLLFEEPNPEIDFDNSPFFVNTELRPWESNGHPRRAAVSAFGIGGTNAHAILEEAPEAEPSGPSRPWQMLLLSAKTETALEHLTDNLAVHLEEHPDLPLADVAYTLQVGRRELERRRFLVCGGREEAVTSLRERTAQRLIDGGHRTDQPPVAFMFSGQGAQYVGMMADLYRGEEVFRQEVDRAAELLRPLLGLDLRDVMYPAPGEDGERLGRTEYTQPALFVVEYALARQWMAWGVRPEAMIGHSIGEYVAACLAGVFSLEDALKLVAARGRLMQAMPGGSMLAVSLPEKEVEPLLGQRLSIAALNSTSRSVVAGPDDAVAALVAELKEKKVSARPLHTSHAFHSQMMEPALAPFLEEVAKVQLHAPQIPYISNVSGTWVTEAEATDPSYWAKHLRGAVRFADGVGELLKEPERLLIEVGPGQSLTTLARQHPSKQEGQSFIASTRHPKKTEHDQQVLLGALGRAWLAGATVDWDGFYAEENRRRVVLPTYPFERRRFYIEASADPTSAFGGRTEKRSGDLADWFHLPLFKPSVAPLPAVSEEGERWLIFLDGGGFGAALAERLTGVGAAVNTVSVAASFAGEGGTYGLDPSTPEDYDALLNALAEDGGLPTRIVHCWTLGDGAETPEALPPSFLKEGQERGFFSLFHLARALGRQKVEGTVHLAAVSNGIHQVTGGETLHPQNALVLGPIQVMPQEYPFLSCRSLDLEAGGKEAVDGGLLNALVGELSGADEDQVIAYRQGRRYVRGFEPLRLDRTDETALPLRQGGTYLITGGLGGIGLELSEYLARTVGAHLVLTGRSALPERDTWAEWVKTHGVDDSTSQKILKVQALEQAGGDVLVVAADVADEGQMRAAVEEARSRFGALHGVVHSAGIAGGGMIQTRVPEDAAAVLWPKTEGTRVLAAVTHGAVDGAVDGGEEPLDFLVLCSSTIAALGNFGQVDYCAGNSFLDAFAHYHTAATGVPTISINWGAWSEVGMAVNTTLPASAGASAGMSATAGAATAEGAQGDAAEEIHPLVGTLVSADAKRRVYSTQFRVARHWMLDEHRVVETPTLPGTTYMEMLRAAWAHTSGETTAQLRDVFFLAPMMVPEGESREARLTLEKAGDGMSFEVQSRAAGAGDDWQQHVLGKIGSADGPALPAFDVDEIRKRCDVEERAIEGDLLTGGEGIVYWGARWQCLEKVWVGRGEALAELALPEKYLEDLEEMPLHPALLDVATAILSSLEESNYLPLSYGRFRMGRPLPARFFSYLRGQDTRGESRETLTADLFLLDENGQTLVEIEGFTMKRVGQAVGRLQESAAGTPSSSASAASASSSEKAKPAQQAGLFAQGGMSSADGVEAFRRILSRRPGRQVVVSPKDFQALLEQSATARSKGALDGLEDLAGGRASHPRPEMQTAFAEPETELEATLAEVWQDVLGLDKVGIHDNFFELGGDSVLGIQILARARESGVELTSDQLFEHQTVAELARAVGGPGAETAVAAKDEDLVTAKPFALAQLEPEALEKIRAAGEIEDLYPLSPLQHGLLLSLIENPNAGLYCEQVSFNLEEDLDLGLTERAWRRVLARHEILRSGFLWRDLDQPLQAVYSKAQLELTEHTWRSLSKEEQQERLKTLAEDERNRGFDLETPPLLRVSVVRLGEKACRILVSYSHLLMDGWTSPMIISEALQTYGALARGVDLDLAKPRPYRDYIAWLAGREAGADRDFWRSYLSGFTAANRLSVVKEGKGVTRGQDSNEIDRPLSPKATTALMGFMRQHRMTVNVATQAAWALLLGYLSDADDVVFGIDLSGRPEELDNVDGMVGVFVNMLPARINLGDEQELVPWLRGLWEKQAELNRHQYSLLSEVQAWSGVERGQPLFDTIYNFANYPSSWMGAGGESVGFRYDSRNQYPLHLTVVPGDALVLRLLYDRTRVDEAAVDRILKGLERVLTAIPEMAGETVGALRTRLREGDRKERVEAGQKASSRALDKLRKKTRRKGAPVAPKE